MTTRQTNLTAIELVARGLADLVDHVAFVGGATVALYIDDPAAEDVRVTTDVDCVVELAGLGEYADWEDRLRKLGFSNDTDPNAPICRWRYSGLSVDIVPTDPSVLGFSNQWYPEAMSHLQWTEIAPGFGIFIFACAYFIASKLEAFKGRGQIDWQASHDLEDVIAVLDGSTFVAAELTNTSGRLSEYLRAELAQLVSHAHADEIIAGHLTPGPTAVARTARIRDLLDRFTSAQPSERGN